MCNLGLSKSIIFAKTVKQIIIGLVGISQSLKLRQNTNWLELIIMSKPLRDDEQLSSNQFSDLNIRKRDETVIGVSPKGFD
jgi:hypothetical protein